MRMNSLAYEIGPGFTAGLATVLAHRAKGSFEAVLEDRAVVCAIPHRPQIGALLLSARCREVSESRRGGRRRSRCRNLGKT